MGHVIQRDRQEITRNGGVEHGRCVVSVDKRDEGTERPLQDDRETAPEEETNQYEGGKDI